jgi:hypothetical protein
VRVGRGVVVAAGLAIAVLAAAAAIGLQVTRPADLTEIGVVIRVDSVSLTDVRGFTIRTPDGRSVAFRVGQLQNGAQFPPGHLAEHAATAVPIVVTYRDEAGTKVAVRLEDAAASSPT